MNYKNNLQSALNENFTLTTDYIVCDNTFDIHAISKIYSTKSSMFMPTAKTEVYSSEIVLVKDVDTLTDDFINTLLDCAVQVEQDEIQTENPAHTFSFISIYIFANKIQNVKSIKKFKHEKTYYKNKHGFISTRLCVYSSSEDKFYTNKFGKDLRFRLT